jgi:hypothetical protein
MLCFCRLNFAGTLSHPRRHLFDLAQMPAVVSMPGAGIVEKVMGAARISRPHSPMPKRPVALMAPSPAPCNRKSCVQPGLVRV